MLCERETWYDPDSTVEISSVLMVESCLGYKGFCYYVNNHWLCRKREILYEIGSEAVSEWSDLGLGRVLVCFWA